jgi:hypothetical protein
MPRARGDGERMNEIFFRPFARRLGEKSGNVLFGFEVLGKVNSALGLSVWERLDTDRSLLVVRW